MNVLARHDKNGERGERNWEKWEIDDPSSFWTKYKTKNTASKSSSY